MALFEVKTKNQSEIDNKPRVFFTCHPEDTNKYFDKVCEDIFKTHDCAVYYTSDMSKLITDAVREVDFERINLIVVPVTYKLLTTPNRAMDEDIPYALRKHIPVLPIVMETGLDALYSKAEKFGELQYLTPYSKDVTEISYELKLKKYLESVLISDEVAERIRKAFDAYIFLSYRKKDRRYANELMKLIHSNPECFRIAIWFDEFLKPGESFKKSIEQMLEDSKLFTLLVTPGLFEKVVTANGEEQDNYVISTELPLARKKNVEDGMEIFAVEMEHTDREKLKEVDIYDFVNVNDVEFKIRLLDAISKIAVSGNDNPEHNFLTGLAYIEGFDVEVNRERGVELITSAAEAGLIEAMEKLYKIYCGGIGAELNYGKALNWAKKISDYYIEKYGEEHIDSVRALSDLAMTYTKLHDYKKARELNEKLYDLSVKIYGKRNSNTLVVMDNLSVNYIELGEYKAAVSLLEKVYRKERKKLGKRHPATMTALHHLGWSLMYTYDYKKALRLQRRAYFQRCKYLGEDDPETLLSMNNLACIYGIRGYHETAMKMKKEAYKLCCIKLGKTHPESINCLNNLAHTYGEIGMHTTAIRLQKKVCENSSRILGRENTKTLSYLDNLATSYYYLGEYDEAFKLQDKIYKLNCKKLGEGHINSLQSLNNLAATLKNKGKINKATELTEKAYNLAYINLGEKNPATLLYLNNLAAMYCNMGIKNPTAYEKAVKYGSDAYNLRCKVLGDKNEDTLTSLNILAFAYRASGNLVMAFNYYNKLYKMQKKIFGARHPETLKTIKNLREASSRL